MNERKTLLEDTNKELKLSVQGGTIRFSFRDKEPEKKHIISISKEIFNPKEIKKDIKKETPSLKLPQTLLENFDDGDWTKEEHIRFLECLLFYGKNRDKFCKYIYKKSFLQISNHLKKFENKIKRDIFLDTKGNFSNILFKNFKPNDLSKNMLKLLFKDETNSLIKIMNLIFKNEELFFFSSDDIAHYLNPDEDEDNFVSVIASNKTNENLNRKIFSIEKNKAKQIKKYYHSLLLRKEREKLKDYKSNEHPKKYVLKFGYTTNGSLTTKEEKTETTFLRQKRTADFSTSTGGFSTINEITLNTLDIGPQNYYEPKVKKETENNIEDTLNLSNLQLELTDELQSSKIQKFYSIDGADNLQNYLKGFVGESEYNPNPRQKINENLEKNEKNIIQKCQLKDKFLEEASLTNNGLNTVFKPNEVFLPNMLNREESYSDKFFESDSNIIFNQGNEDEDIDDIF